MVLWEVFRKLSKRPGTRFASGAMGASPLGLKRGTVKVIPYNPLWAGLFEEERRALKAIFGDRFLAIEHVGSTAVPGLPAKPIIDINVAITSLTDAQDFIEKLPELGYQYFPKRSYPVPEYAYRHFFAKGPESSRTHYLKLIELDDKEWEDSIFFRDYLRTSKETRDRYGVLKERLAEKYASDRASYTESKDEFIRDVLRRTKRGQ